ncbi:hypothetical protein [Microbacterium suaedae]|uniref:hypothetical protein n=1 Tax=Microbacterium suaedae TaxID=2067813 RepID=UPI000DA214C9|nr:hypothetical protein [Microbacterium suaedae]
MNTVNNHLAEVGIAVLAAVSTLLSWLLIPIIALAVIVGYGLLRLGLAVRSAVSGRSETPVRPVIVRETLARAV